MKGQRTSRRFYKYILFIAGTLMAGVLAFFITINVYKVDEIEKKPNEIAKENESKTVTGIPDKAKLLTDESSIRTAPNVEQMANNKSSSQIENLKTNVPEAKNNTKSTEKKDTSTVKKVEFVAPVTGSIGLNCSIDKLIFSETLEEWITHTGIDIKSDELSPVKAVSDGVVKDIKLDPRYGVTVILQHDNGFKSIYSNLSTIDLVKLNQKVKMGDIISGVGTGYGFETEEGPHIHFEMMKDNNLVDPNLYIKF
jgi:murein DD-endopeptidase MepM/ murein hydrolase activator NlpD